MTYKKIYKILDKKGIIDEVISTYANEILDTKFKIVEVLQYMEYFYNSSTFRRMEYWKDFTHSKHSEKYQEIYKILVNAFCEILIEQKENDIKMLQYWKNN